MGLRSAIPFGALTAAAGALLALMSPAHAAANSVGWALADQPDAQYTPNPAFRYNSRGGGVSVLHTGTGQYQVKFGSLYSGLPDNVQITAYRTAGYCNSSGWGQDIANAAGIVAFVDCFDPAGNPADRHFTILYEARSPSTGSAARSIAHLLANQPSTASYVPSPSYNSTGGTNTITRNGTGEYDVYLPGLDGGGLTLITTLSDSTCSDVPFLSSSGLHIGVDCNDRNGQPVDQYFSLLFARKQAPARTRFVNGAYAFANQPAQTTRYKTLSTASFNGYTGRAPLARKTDTGRYIVTFPGAPAHKTSNVQVTAYLTGARCNVFGWTADTVSVRCFAVGSGAPLDDRFAVALDSVD